MKILSLGSLNIDFVYSVGHICLEGETLPARALERKQGGKGLNQAAALARAGAPVFMAGCVGPDGDDLAETLARSGADVSYVRKIQEPSGSAMIQLADSGANSIVVYGGANRKVTPQMIDEVLSHFSPGDYILLQNEISCVEYAFRAAKARGMKLAFNPSPISEELFRYPLELADILILNELEGRSLAGIQSSSGEEILAALARRFPQAAVVLTLGEQGALYQDGRSRLFCPAQKVPVIDTTGAGDTFCGYFLACSMKGMPPEQALVMATQASALAIGTKGAADSIPSWAQVEAAAARPGR